jgi:hypothetical protein
LAHAELLVVFSGAGDVLPQVEGRLVVGGGLEG